MRKFIEEKLVEIDSMLGTYEDNQQLGEDYREIIKEVEDKTKELKQDKVRAFCHAIRDGGISHQIATQTLIDCLVVIEPENHNRDWLLVSEVADEMRVGQTKVHTWIREGRLQAFNVNDRGRPSYRIEKSELANMKPPRRG